MQSDLKINEIMANDMLGFSNNKKTMSAYRM